jgi:shikimate kinase
MRALVDSDAECLALRAELGLRSLEPLLAGDDVSSGAGPGGAARGTVHTGRPSGAQSAGPLRGQALIGLPGTGKSAVGRHLARALGLDFLDLDSAIEEAAGMSIPEIFEKEGEGGFRARESEALHAAALRSAGSTPAAVSSPAASNCATPSAEAIRGGGLVLATGGGIVLAEGNRRLLRSSFLVVWLYGRPETLAGRCIDGGRPLLAGACTEDRIRDLDLQRRALYADCADLLVSTEGRSAKRVAAMLAAEFHGLF